MARREEDENVRRDRLPKRLKHKPKRKPAVPKLPATTPSSPNAQSAAGLIYAPYPLTNEWAYASAVAASQEVAQGYDIHAASTQGIRRSTAVNAANAILTDGSGSGSSQMSIFITAVSIDTSLSGSNGQAHLVRDFYPHNFVQPNFVIEGQSIDQQDYGILCEFVHSAQHKAVENGYANLTQLYVIGRDKARSFDGSRVSGRSVGLTRAGTLMPRRTSDPGGTTNGTYFNQSIRGSHQPILAKGYISSMPRTHQKFEYAPEWTFDFVVTAMLSGMYSENIAFVRQEKTWKDMLEDAKRSGLIDTAALKRVNAKRLAAAKKDVTAAFGDPTLPTSQSGGGNSSSGGGAGSAAKGHYDKNSLKQLWTSNGGGGDSNTAAAIAMAESGGDPKSHCLNCAGVPEDSRGLWQINVQANPQYASQDLYDPNTNAKAAIQMSGNGSNFQPWSTFTSGAYRKFA